MTIVYYVGGKIVGLSSDVKPTLVPANTTFIESDTFTEFIFDGVTTWNQIGASAFSPQDIAGLEHWYDASELSTITKDGSDKVSQWDDKQGTDNLEQVTPSIQPLWESAERNGLDVLDFTGYIWMAGEFTTISQPFTIAAVIKLTDNGTNGWFSDSFTSSIAQTELPSTDDFFRMNAGTNLQASNVGLRGNWVDIFYIFDGGTSKCIVKGIEVLTGNAGANALTQGLCVASDTARAVNGNIKAGEITVYNKVLSAEEISDLQDYFNSKWGQSLKSYANQESAGGTNGAGVQGIGNLFSTGNSLLSENVTKIVIPISKTGAPTGNIQAGIWNTANDLQLDLGVLDITTVTGTIVDYTFENLAGHIMANGEVIGVQFLGGDGSNRADFRRTSGDTDPNTGQSSFNGTTWGAAATKQATMEIF